MVDRYFNHASLSIFAEAIALTATDVAAVKDSQFNHRIPSIGGRCTRVNRAFAWSNARKSPSWVAHRRTVASLDRLSTKNPRRGAPKTQGRPARASRSWSPGQALIEFDLRWWWGGLLPMRIVARFCGHCGFPQQCLQWVGSERSSIGHQIDS
jgi:hypothetical protein